QLADREAARAQAGREWRECALVGHRGESAVAMDREPRAARQCVDATDDMRRERLGRTRRACIELVAIRRDDEWRAGDNFEQDCDRAHRRKMTARVCCAPCM